jgi:hypothetical protein
LLKRKDPPQNVDRCVKIGKAVLMEHPMKHLLNSNKNPSVASQRERRKHARKACAIEGNFRAQSRWHKGSIQNISEGGAFIRTLQGGALSPGEDIFLIARIRVLREQFRGKIAWVGQQGMGVEFQTTERI